MTQSLEPTITGCLMGTAVGDALGLACEGLSRRRQAQMFRTLDGYKLLPFGRFGKGMTSDDTEHTCMLAQSLIVAGQDATTTLEQHFARNFAWRLRFWLLGLPAGIGFATLRAILKLWHGFPVRLSGVFSAGNGPAMRAALIGVCYGGDPVRMRALVRAATRITHTDPKAEYGAFAVALAAQLAATRDNHVEADEFLSLLRQHIDDTEFCTLMSKVVASVNSGTGAAAFADSIGCTNGVSGYMYHTLPCVLHVWLTHQHDYRSAVTTMIRLGGDADTTAAIVGAIVGARVGKSGIPAEWVDNLAEWPRSARWMEQLGVKLAASCTAQHNGGSLWINPAKLLFRNILFYVHRATTRLPAHAAAVLIRRF
jgi:ADP-ribosyl-[dinitrogen reductase] hydrolase